MSACTVWELVLTLAVVVLAGFAYHYRNLVSRMKTRARIYIQYVPREQLTGEERVVLEHTSSRIVQVELSSTPYQNPRLQ